MSQKDITMLSKKGLWMIQMYQLRALWVLCFQQTQTTELQHKNTTNSRYIKLYSFLSLGSSHVTSSSGFSYIVTLIDSFSKKKKNRTYFFEK